MKNQHLVIVWDWNHKNNLEKLSKNNNIQFLWVKYWKDLVKLLQNSKWLIFPWEEDFWITPVEAMFAGKPVFAYRGGWLLETSIEGKTWEFFDDNTWKDFKEKFLNFDEKVNSWFYKEKEIIKNAEKFWSENFEKQIKKIVFES